MGANMLIMREMLLGRYQLREFNREFTCMEGNEGFQSPKDLSKLTLRHDVQLQHGIIVHLTPRSYTDEYV